MAKGKSTAQGDITLIALVPITHDDVDYAVGDKIENLNKDQAEALTSVGAAKAPEAAAE